MLPPCDLKRIAFLTLVLAIFFFIYRGPTCPQGSIAVGVSLRKESQNTPDPHLTENRIENRKISTDPSLTENRIDNKKTPTDSHLTENRIDNKKTPTDPHLKERRIDNTKTTNTLLPPRYISVDIVDVWAAATESLNSQYQKKQASKLQKEPTRILGFDALIEAQLLRRFGEIERKGHAIFRGMSVLCVGARHGGEVRTFTKLGSLSVGIDLEPAGAHNLLVLPGDAHHIQFADAVFDHVYTNVMDHIPDQTAFIKEAFRVLRPSGLLWLDVDQNPPDAWSMVDNRKQLPIIRHMLLDMGCKPLREQQIWDEKDAGKWAFSCRVPAERSTASAHGARHASEQNPAHWRWRHDGVCGKLLQSRCPTPEEFQQGHTSQTLAWLNNAPCCSAQGFCGSSEKHCNCPTCIDSRKILR